jgi:type IV pilus assembly protein PilY1
MKILSAVKTIGSIALFLAASHGVQAQTPEIPVLVHKVATAKTMFILDDSGSMAAIVEHPEFSATAPVATNTANNIPGIIFRLESGAAAPTNSQIIRPVLIEYNYLYNNVYTNYRGQVTGNIYETGSLSTASAIDAIEDFGCTTTTGYCCPPVGSCTNTNVYGINNSVLYSNSTIRGSSVFSVNNLAKINNINVTDTSGHEYLYVNAHSNLYYTVHNNWGSYWGKFDSRGNPLSYNTRVFTSPGATVKFNNREVFLSAGLYRIEYLRWIFYGATPEQLATLPGYSRMQIVKDVMERLILDNPAVAFGLATLNGSLHSPGVHSGYLMDQWYTPEGNTNSGRRPKIRVPIGSSPATLIAALDTIGPSGGTPLSHTYIETLRYFQGQTDNDPYCSNCQYVSPVTSACDGHFVVLLTDGLPTSDSSNSLAGSFINGSCDGVADEGSATNQGCSGTTCPRFLDDAACTAYNRDFSSSLPGQQRIISYAVGLGLDYALLNDFASDGGTGQALRADTSDQISSTLQNIVTNIVNTPVSGAGVTLAESFGQTGRVYRPRFRADVWRGNIDAFQFSNGSLQFLYDMGDILEGRNISSRPRNIFAGHDPDGDGNTRSSINFSTANATQLRPLLFHNFINNIESPTLLPAPLSNFSQNTAAINLINFIHGASQSGLRIRDQDTDGLVEKLGDIVYSRPIEVGPRNGNYNKMDGYAEFVAGRTSQPHLLLVGANDGMLHAFDTQDGSELWAYIPSSLLKHLEKLARPQYNVAYRRSYVDADINVEDAFVNGSWKTLAMFGLRTGGTTYTVLDITDRRNPQLLFEVNADTVAGQSWTTPIVAPSNGPLLSSDPSQYTWHMIVGTGEAKTSSGTNIVLYNLASSSPSPQTLSLNSSDPAGTKTTSILAVQTDADLSIDRLYVGTESGDLYRINTTGTVSQWTRHRVYSGSSSQPITATPTAVLVENPLFNPDSQVGIDTKKLAVGVYFGTGRYDTQSDISTTGTTTQSILGVFDPVNTDQDDYSDTLSGLTKAQLKNQSLNFFGAMRQVNGIYRIPTNQSGFYVDLATSISLGTGSFINPVGMVTEPPVNLRGALLFSTFLPNQGLCELGGYGFLQAVNFRTGGGIAADYLTNGKEPTYNGGIPDADADGDIDQADLQAVYNSGKIMPLFDARVESINMSLPNPYVMNGSLEANDLRLHQSNGGFISSVTSLGNTGAPSAPSVLFSDGQIVIQPAYPVPPTVGAGVTPSASVPPPTTIKINIYNIVPNILSFHEITE